MCDVAEASKLRTNSSNYYVGSGSVYKFSRPISIEFKNVELVTYENDSHA